MMQFETTTSSQIKSYVELPKKGLYQAPKELVAARYRLFFNGALQRTAAAAGATTLLQGGKKAFEAAVAFSPMPKC